MCIGHGALLLITDDMVTKKVIQTLYRQFRKPPKSPDELNLGLIFDYAMDNHGIFIDEDNLYIGSVEPSSPFATIELKRIHEIVEFEKVLDAFGNEKTIRCTNVVIRVKLGGQNGI